MEIFQDKDIYQDHTPHIPGAMQKSINLYRIKY